MSWLYVIRSHMFGLYKIAVSFLLCFVIANTSHAVTQNTKIIKDIVIEGNKKIGTQAILNKIESTKGKPYSKEQVSKDLEKIFEMGHFYDIEVYIDNGVIRYVVEERPVVVDIVFEGNKKINSDELFETLDLKQDDFLDMSKLNTSITKITDLYESKGFFLANLIYEIKEEENEQNKDIKQVSLVFRINENKKVKIKKINIEGNNAITDEELKASFVSKEKTFFSFISGGGRYSEIGLERDLQVVKFLYLNKGYINAKVVGSQVFISPNKRDIIINIDIEEGEQHTVGQVNFSGDLLFTIDEHMEKLKTISGSVFAYDTLQSDLENLQAMYGDLGYAFVNVVPNTKLNAEDKVIDLDFSIDHGEKVNFGKFDIVGNQSTRDKVIRREMSIVEGELYNETKKRRSLNDIRRLGFFENVTFQQKIDEEKANTINYDVVVEERSTGSFQLGAGYGSYSKFSFNGRIEKQNLFGRGQSLGISANLSGIEKFYNLNFTDPYFLDTSWSAGVDIYSTNYIVQDQYRDTRTGGALRLGHPIAPYLYGFIKYMYEDADIDASIGNNFKFDDDEIESAEGALSSVTFSLDYDKRNDRWMPSDGFLTSASLEVAGLGGDKRFIETEFNVRFYEPIWSKLVFRNNLTFSMLSPYGGREVPFNELYRLGGINTLRGFGWFDIGATSYDSDGEPFVRGGLKQVYYNAELQFPLVDATKIFGVVFYDIGMAEDVLELSKLRHNIGFGFRWFSPMGPLRFEWGFPISKKEGEGGQFQFSIGTPF